MRVFSYKLPYSGNDKEVVDENVTNAIENVINNREGATLRAITVALNNAIMTPNGVSGVYIAINNYLKDSKINPKNYEIITAILDSNKGAGEAANVTLKTMLDNAIALNDTQLVGAILASKNVSFAASATRSQKAADAAKRFAAKVEVSLVGASDTNYKLEWDLESEFRKKISNYNNPAYAKDKEKIGDMVMILGATYKGRGGKDAQLLAEFDKVMAEHVKTSPPSSPTLSSSTVSVTSSGVSGGMGRTSSASSLSGMVNSARDATAAVTSSVAEALSKTTAAVSSGVAEMLERSPQVIQRQTLSINTRLEAAINSGKVENLNDVLSEIKASSELGDKNPFTLALKQKNEEVISALYRNDFTNEYFSDALKVVIQEKNVEGIRALFNNRRKPNFNPFIGAPKEVVGALLPSLNKEQVLEALKLKLVKKKIAEIDLEFVKECIIRGELTPAEMKKLVLASGLVIINPAAMQTVIQALGSSNGLMEDFVKPVFKIAVENLGGKQIEHIEPILKVLNSKERMEVLGEGLKAAVSKENPMPKSILAMLQTKGLSSDERKFILDYKLDGKPLSDWISEQRNNLEKVKSTNVYSNDIKVLEELEKLTKTATRFDKLDSALAKAIKTEKTLNGTLAGELGSMKTYKLLSSANVLGFEWYDKLLMETLVRPKIAESATYKKIQEDYASKKIETRDPYKNVGNDITVEITNDPKKDAKKLYNNLSEEMFKITRGAVIGKDVTKVEEQDFKRLKKVESLIKDGEFDKAKHEALKDLRAQYKEKLGEVALSR